MSLSDFLKKKKEAKENSKKNKKHKVDFQEKCISLLENIKDLNEKRYHELKKVFHQKYDKVNVSKKLLSGFYAQLVQEYNQLLSAAGKKIQKTTKKVAAHYKVKEITEKLKTRAKEWESETEVVRKNTKAVVEQVKKTLKPEDEKKVTKKKATKKTTKKAAKKVTKKNAPKTAKKAAKKVTKKTTKKAAPKTAKKATSTKKVVKKVSKKTAKKKIAKK